MSRIVLLTLLYLITLHCWGKGNVTFTTKDSARIVRLLTTAKKISPSPTSWTLYFARQFVGTPYVGGTLDRAREERLVINLPELDCTTYVEQVLALARCAELGSTSFEDFCEQLRHIRYVGGEIAYVKRQHYFTGWIEDNEKELIVKEIQLPNPPFTASISVNVNWMTTHVKNYKMLSAHPEWVSGIRNMEKAISGKRYRYIPKAAVNNTKLLRQTIHDGDILAIVTDKQGLDISHIGFAVWHADGLHLLNASSIHKRVIDEPMTLRQYLWKSRRRLGIRVIRCLGPS